MKLRNINSLLPAVGMFLFLLAAALVLQFLNGAFRSDFGGHPDEAAHFITGLMVRDYLVSGIPENPMRYAEEYYDHYPKVALGHYPPGFYALEGAWLALFPVSKASALVFMAVLAALFGTLAFSWARERLPLPHAAMIGIVTVALPLTQAMTATVMADLALAVACLLAARSFARFLAAPGWWPSLCFGIWAAAAAMVKGSGLFLALLPPLAILIAWRPGVLRKPALWIAVLPVVLIVGPWMLYSRNITAEGMIDRTPLEHLGYAIPYFAGQFLKGFYPVILLLALAGMVRLLRGKDTMSARSPFWAIHLALPVGLVAFFSLVPAGLEPRYLLPAIPSILCLAAAGLTGWPGRPQALAAGVVAGTLLLQTAQSTMPAKDFKGFSSAADAVLAGPDGKYLISSDARGEGAFIVEVAIRDRSRPSTMVKRGSKILATSDWLGRDYETVFEDDAELAEFLRQTDLAGIVVDEAIPPVFRRSYHDMLERVLASGGVPFEEVATTGAFRPGFSANETIRVYRHTQP